MAGKLRFIAGRAGAGKTALCEREIAEELRENPIGPACVLLLPEHMTYRVERELAAKLMGDGFLRAYVFGFRRFARQVLLGTGGLLRPRITEVGRRLLLRKILTHQGKELAFFRRAARQRGFSATLSETLKELKSYELTPEKLGEAADAFAETEDALSDKLRDLALLEASFAQEMKGRYDDAEDMMNLLIEKLPSSKFIQGAKFWVDGFIFFNPQERQVLAELLAAGCDISVTMPLDPVQGSPENRRETGLFNRSWRTMLQLRELAQAVGAKTTILPLSGPQQAGEGRFYAPALAAIERGLFHHPIRPQTQAGAGLQIVEAANRRIEVEAAAADILRLAREEHLRWRDIGILVREPEVYDGLLKLVLEDHAIPFFIDGRRETVHHPLAELVRSALEAVHGWRYEPVIRTLRTGFFSLLTREQIDKLENYVLEFGVRGAGRWTMEEPWPWFRRHSLDDEETAAEKDAAALAEIDDIRRQAAAPLKTLSEQMKSAKTVRAYTAAIYAFLEALRVPETLERWMQESERGERLASASEHRQVWDDLLELFDQLVEAGGDEAMSRKEYEAILGDGLDALEMKIIPPGLDYVTVASFDQNSLMNAKAIYILGAGEGVMPRRSREKGLFSDADRQHLSEAGLEIASGGLDGSLAEKFLLYRGFTEAGEHLWVSYPLADDEGSGLAPSAYIDRLRKLLPDAPFLSLPLESLEPDMDEQASDLSPEAVLRLSDGRKSVTGLASALRGLRERGTMAPYWRDVYNWAEGQAALEAPLHLALSGLFAKPPEKNLPVFVALALFAPKRRMAGSVTRFEEFSACPFQHFADYGLRLQERQEHGFHAFDFGKLLHSCLRACGERLHDDGRSWRDVGEGERHEMVGSVLQEVAPRLQNELLLSTKAYEHLLSRIGLTAERSLQRLIEMDSASAFHPVAFERMFGRGTGAMPPLTYDLPKGIRLDVTGQIDRIDFDESGRYFLIVDYKTGNAALNILDVYYGLKLQLLTYLLVTKNLLARTEDHERLPAAILYCLVKYKWWNTDVKASPEEIRKKFDKDLRMPGWVLADPEVIRSIDATGRFIPVRVTTKGEINKNDRVRVKTKEEFNVLIDYVDRVLEKTGEAILSGDIAASPYEKNGMTPCKYCLYRSLCGFDPTLAWCRYRRLTKLDEAEAMDTMEWEAKQGKQGGNVDA
ncbi:MAG: helicase-exonuclease AddAB subunit AddB [Selenomonas sp.]|uniref:helicase-exonuclease AddAB subunit AddB n=1 Tax=Selenomonas sp. TaxID=2053611 RepID=UPI0025F86C42|nr:helicase-exonuclease AddAB subunit AddB [Selenomonas sp.]MCI6233006.1 helicase-exonuclease AddAB subunit AddB [Selenomonas sp.]